MSEFVSNQVYMVAADATIAQVGAWQDCKFLGGVLSLTVGLATGLTGISGTLICEATDDDAKALVYQINLPVDSLHKAAAVSGVAVQADGTVQVTAQVTGCFGIIVAQVAKFMRFRWASPSGGSSPNTLNMRTFARQE